MQAQHTRMPLALRQLLLVSAAVVSQLCYPAAGARAKKGQRDWGAPSPATAAVSAAAGSSNCTIDRVTVCPPDSAAAEQPADCIQPADFAAQYLGKKPAILQGLTDGWRARSWTKKSFLKKYGKLDIRAAPADLVVTAGPEYPGEAVLPVAKAAELLALNPQLVVFDNSADLPVAANA